MKPHRLALSAAATVVLCVALGYGLSRYAEMTPENITPDQPSPVKQVIDDRAVYANDLQRLDVLTTKVQQVAGTNYVAIPGGPADSSSQAGPTVSIDYGLFDQLSDSAAAVMIAQAIVSKSRQYPADNSQDEGILHIDQTVGRYIAKAGFSEQGFTQWLEKHNRRFPAPNPVSNQARNAAFMRGYLIALNSVDN